MNTIDYKKIHTISDLSSIFIAFTFALASYVFFSNFGHNDNITGFIYGMFVAYYIVLNFVTNLVLHCYNTSTLERKIFIYESSQHCSRKTVSFYLLYANLLIALIIPFFYTLDPFYLTITAIIFANKGYELYKVNNVVNKNSNPKMMNI